MQPYFATHAVGAIYYVIALSWYLIELVQFLRQRERQVRALRFGNRGFWPAFVAIAAVSVVSLFGAPHLVPAAAIGHDAIAFGAGMVMLVVGAALRVWSFVELGPYFTFTVTASNDQPVVARGPYRVLRHPGYAGGLLATVGIAVLYGNWVSLATVAVLWLTLVVWRIRIEERALLTTLDGRYRSYAATRKRLVPLIW